MWRVLRKKTIYCGYKKWCRPFLWQKAEAYVGWKQGYDFFVALKFNIYQRNVPCCLCENSVYKHTEVAFQKKNGLAPILWFFKNFKPWTECKLMNIKMIAIENIVEEALWCQYGKRWATNEWTLTEWHNESCFATNKQMWKVSMDQRTEPPFDELRRRQQQSNIKKTIKHSTQSPTPDMNKRNQHTHKLLTYTH